VLDRLLATLSNENAGMGKIADIIEKDMVIAGNVLRLVNSALYGRRGTVNSVRHAVSLLGINKLRNTVFAMSISRVWSQVRTGAGWSTARFNLHSVACAIMADLLAQRAPVNYPEGAFAAGLFHDLGRLLIAVGLPAEHAEIQGIYLEGVLSLDRCEEEVIGVTHAELSAEALATWNLPAAIQAAVRCHHDFEPTAPGVQLDLATVIRCADEYINFAGVSIQPEDEARTCGFSEPFAPLGIELAKADFVSEFKTELDVLGGVFH
jgi:HD-like signal output (HDOD) protein